MHARDLMTHTPVFVHPDDTIADAASMMAAYDVGTLPVVDDRDGDRLVGVLTDRDIVVRCTSKHHDAATCPVEHHMTAKDLATVRPETPLSEIVAKMERFQVRRVPVVDGDSHVLGVVGQADLARCAGPDNPVLVEEMLLRVSAPAQAPSSW